LKELTRREFFTGLGSKDTLKKVFSTWNSFSREVQRESLKNISCEEAGLLLRKNIDKIIAKKLSKMKGG